MIDLLRKYTATFLEKQAGKVAWQVQSVLSKIGLCRTEKLLGRIYECPGCQRRCAVYNSCGERHCPQCSGARRAQWLDRSAALLLPGVNYFQVIFTLPDKLSRLVLGNRRELYRLLFRSAWTAMKHELGRQNIDPAALLVLHTWNQELGHHPHIHALVPGAGPSANKNNDPCWVTASDTTRPWRDKPSLVDNVTLGRTFRDKFVRGLGWLIRNDKLKLTDEWSMLRDPKLLRRWLKSLRETDWNVFIEAPPHGKSDPAHVLKYLTRYLTGGPISDGRIESDDNGMVTFLARSKSKARIKAPRQIKVPGSEFVRRWSLHVLPKGFTRSRCYGGWHGSRRETYLETCRQLLPVEPSVSQPDTDTVATGPEGTEQPAACGIATSPLCPHCQIEMQCIADSNRPSWRIVLGNDPSDCQLVVSSRGNSPGPRPGGRSHPGPHRHVACLPVPET